LRTSPALHATEERSRICDPTPETILSRVENVEPSAVKR